MWPRVRPMTLLQEVGPRVLVDLVSLCVAWLIAVTLYWGGFIIYLENSKPTELSSTLKVLHFQNVACLVFTAIPIFVCFGFYTHTRAYQNRYKFLVIVNAVSLSFMIEVLIYTYVLRLGRQPRGLMLLAWIVSVLIITGSRVLKNQLSRSYSFSIARKPACGDRDVESVLVIGGAGYIGSVLSRQLLEEGYRVRVLDSLLFGDGSLSDLSSNPQFELLRADFRHIGSLVKAAQGMDAVIHLAAIVGDPACSINTDLTTEINYAATRMVIEVCNGAGVNRLLFASTCSVYGVSDFLMDERSETTPISLYAHTKLDSERAFLGGRTSVLHPTILRLATVFGLSPRPRFDLVLNLLTARAVRDGKIMIFNRNQWRPFIHVKDVARAFVCSIKAPIGAVSGEIFNVGSFKLNYSLGEVAEKIRHQLPQLEIEFKENLDKRNYRVSFDKIHSYLGFTCKTSLEEGIEEIRRSLENGFVKDYRDRVFSNYEFLAGGGDELLKSEPAIRLFTVLEPADAITPVTASKAFCVETASQTIRG
jgi:nucleoside-diphosphate-sugar epimerase